MVSDNVVSDADRFGKGGPTFMMKKKVASYNLGKRISLEKEMRNSWKSKI